VLFDPFQQAARIVQAQSHGRVPLELFEERQVGLLVDLFVYGIEVADWLMRVNQKYEMKGGHSSTPPAILFYHDMPAGTRRGFSATGGKGP
jgi:hypothetical protein